MKSLLILVILMWQTEPIKPAKQHKAKHKKEHIRKVPIFY